MTETVWYIPQLDKMFIDPFGGVRVFFEFDDEVIEAFYIGEL